jgi:uncharacterized protein YhaN
VGPAGAVPLLVEDAFESVTPQARQRALGQLERFSDVVQIVYFTDQADVEDWATGLGPERATVQRFSAGVHAG